MSIKTTKHKHVKGSEYLENNTEEPVAPNLITELNKTLELSKKMLQMMSAFPNVIKSSGTALGMKQQVFIKAVFELAKEDPQLLPHEFKVENLDLIVGQINILNKIRQNLEQAHKKIRARLHELGSEEQKLCRKICGLIQSFAAADVPGMQEFQDQLKINYPKNRKKSESTAPKTILSGYKENNGDFLLMEKKIEKGVRIRKNKVPLSIIPHKDREAEKS
jgi:hypothetical protein